MAKDGFDKKNDRKYQGDIKKPVENTDDRAGSTLVGKTIIRFPDGREYIAKETTLQKNEATGQWEKIIKEISVTDTSGRYINPDMIVGISWQGHQIPSDHLASCANPYDDHGYRLVFLHIDGSVTEKGNVLCSDCYKKNEKKQKFKKWFKWIYNPEIY